MALPEGKGREIRGSVLGREGGFAELVCDEAESLEFRIGENGGELGHLREHEAVCFTEDLLTLLREANENCSAIGGILGAYKEPLGDDALYENGGGGACHLHVLRQYIERNAIRRFFGKEHDLVDGAALA